MEKKLNAGNLHSTANLRDFVKHHQPELELIANAVRSLSMDAVLKANSGHIGLPLGAAEIGTFLYFALMQHAPANPTWANRDRFVLSAGHGSMLQYALLHLAGYDLSLDDIKSFRQLHSRTPGHPEYGETQGVECTTGPLGQGISHAVGMALAERMWAAQFNSSSSTIVDHRTYVLAGDGCLMEGISGEACSFAGHMKLNKLIVVYDSNSITIDGHTDISFTENVELRFKSYGWNVVHAQGNDWDSLSQAFQTAYEFSTLAQGTTGPTCIIAKTVPGQGSPRWQGKHKIHGNPMSAEDVLEAKKYLGIEDTTPFHVTPLAYTAAKKLVKFRSAFESHWQQSVVVPALKEWESVQPLKLQLWNDLTEFSFDESRFADVLNPKDFCGSMATRVASGRALSQIAQHDERWVGGSADLAGSNNTQLSFSSYVSSCDFSGRNIHFGVREHAMAAIANGLALHGGLRPYCATFEVFSDYLRPALRLAALMKVPTVFILTHDSLGVGEDGPTHQPVEHAAALRAIPNTAVFRPADALETAAVWNFALRQQSVPTVLLLSRQTLPDLDNQLAQHGLPCRDWKMLKRAVAQGAYILKDFNNSNKSNSGTKVTLVASGSEVQLALQAAVFLEQQSWVDVCDVTLTLDVRVVSVAAPQLLAKQPLTLNTLCPAAVPTFSIEAGSAQGWGEIVGRNGGIFHMDSFGASGPAEKLFEHFGFTSANFAQFVTLGLGLKSYGGKGNVR